MMGEIKRADNLKVVSLAMVVPALVGMGCLQLSFQFSSARWAILSLYP
jgi:hypothetical protein